MKVITNLFFVAALAILAVCGSALGLEVLEPGYVVETYATYSCPEMQYAPRGITFDPYGNLYLSQWGDYYSYEGAIYRISPDKSVTKWVDGLGTPRRMVWASGTDYGDYLYVADGTPRDILRINPDGTVSTFSHVSTGPHCLALDRTGDYGGYMYTATRARDHTYRVAPDGSVTMFSNFPGWTDGGGPVDMDFDPGTNYGGLM